MSVNLDSLDFEIIHQLQLDGRMSITDLAERVGSSRPTVTSRLRRLMDKRLLLLNGGLSLRACGFKMACVGLEVKNDSNRSKLEECLRVCPRVLNVYRTPSKANIHITLWGEDEQTVNSTIESFRDFISSEIVYTHYLGTPVEGDVIIPVVPMKDDVTPCSRKCGDCHRYENDWCLGCPSTMHYKNPVAK